MRDVMGQIQSLMVAGTRLDAALTYYATVKDSPERFGVCHNIAVGIVCDLADRGEADGWAWCRGTIDGDIDHSWVECDGIGSDMGDANRLRCWPTSTPPFRIDGRVRRYNAAQTLEWERERETAEALRKQLLEEVLAVPDVKCAAVIVAEIASGIPVPEPTDAEFGVPRLARFGSTVMKAQAVAHGFGRALLPEDKERIASLFPGHSLTWSHVTIYETLLKA